MNMYHVIIQDLTHLVLAGVTGWFFSQLFKSLLNMRINKTLSLKYFLKCMGSDGDFPSSHTCFSTTLFLVALPKLIECIKDSNNYHVSLIALLISVSWAQELLKTIKDSCGVRGTLKSLCVKTKSICEHVGENFESYYNVENKKDNTNSLQNFWAGLAESINVNVGHMPHEVIGGVCVSIFLSTAFNSYIYHYYNLLVIDIIALIGYIGITFCVLAHEERFFAFGRKYVKPIVTKFKK